ncbi:MAG TPA: hypothetical protein PLW65_22290 [Pseudomonadota bacterium]|nr:hypothetical protein [Pseudomonadota bacterium]
MARPKAAELSAPAEPAAEDGAAAGASAAAAPAAADYIDPAHWLYRLTAEQWLGAADNEL